MIYKDAAPLALESGVTRVGNLEAFCEAWAWGVGGEVGGARCEVGRSGFSAARRSKRQFARASGAALVVVAFNAPSSLPGSTSRQPGE